jgi:hypothetical protein
MYDLGVRSGYNLVNHSKAVEAIGPGYFYVGNKPADYMHHKQEVLRLRGTPTEQCTMRSWRRIESNNHIGEHNT